MKLKICVLGIQEKLQLCMCIYQFKSVRTISQKGGENQPTVSMDRVYSPPLSFLF